jgi:serine/threonine-protein kinase HipA
MRAQLVFFLFGATDGHAKNFSVTLLSTGYRLTPIYDVMTIFPELAARQIEIKEAKLAMSVGKNHHYRIREIRRRHWEQTADACGFSLNSLHQLLEDFFAKEKLLDTLANQLGREVPETLIHSVIAGIRKGLKNLED